MKKLQELKTHLKEGRVYRRSDMAQWSNAVDRHAAVLVKEGFLEKLSPGVYHVPKKTVFGAVPPEEALLVRTFLKDDDFLLTSPNAYNTLGVGTTQLYNKRVVYNHKRHGEFTLGGRTFFFHAKHRFPKKMTPEFLVVDLLNNLDKLAEDRNDVLARVIAKVLQMDLPKLRLCAKNYGSIRTKAILRPYLASNQSAHA
jgi:hypothetical protein